MKKSFLISISALSLLAFSGCENSENTENNILETSSTPVPTVTLTPAQEKIVEEYGKEEKDPLVELLSANNKPANYLLEEKEFLAQWKEKNGVLIDLRTPQEIEEIPMLDPSAKNFNVYSPTFAENFRNLDKSAPYFIYCAHGNRSASVYASMKKAEFTNVFELKGGISGK